LRGKNEFYTTDTRTPDGKTHEPEAVCRKVTSGPEHGIKMGDRKGKALSGISIQDGNCSKLHPEGFI